MTSSNRNERREPCGNCPFRRSAPLAHWCPQHYLMLANLRDTEGSVGATLFCCHKDKDAPPEERGLCVGWLLDQRARGVPSLALRLALVRRPDRDELCQQLEEIDGEEDCYDTVDELVRANLKRDKELYPGRYRPKT